MTDATIQQGICRLERFTLGFAVVVAAVISLFIIWSA